MDNHNQIKKINKSNLYKCNINLIYDKLMKGMSLEDANVNEKDLQYISNNFFIM